MSEARIRCLFWIHLDKFNTHKFRYKKLGNIINFPNSPVMLSVWRRVWFILRKWGASFASFCQTSPGFPLAIQFIWLRVLICFSSKKLTPFLSRSVYSCPCEGRPTYLDNVTIKVVSLYGVCLVTEGYTEGWAELLFSFLLHTFTTSSLQA